jgi:FkbM family methyltransferase
VIVLEPASENHELLVRNVALNDLHNVTIRQAALVGQGHRARIYLSDYGSGGHSIVDRLVSPGAACEDVEGVTLGDLFRDYQLPQCEFLKLDCEGAEFEVLRTLDRDTARRIRRLVMEYHTFPDRDKREQAGELIDRLIELGFKIDRYTDVAGTYWGMIYARQVEDAGSRIGPA